MKRATTFATSVLAIYLTMVPAAMATTVDYYPPETPSTGSPVIAIAALGGAISAAGYFIRRKR